MRNNAYPEWWNRGIAEAEKRYNAEKLNAKMTEYEKQGNIEVSIRELKHVGRQHDDGQNKFLQINYSKENLSYIIIRMNLV